MAYIRFAKEEGELFKLLFMRDRSKEKAGEDKELLLPLLALIRKYFLLHFLHILEQPENRLYRTTKLGSKRPCCNMAAYKKCRLE